ncbi:MAG: glycosyltransferase [Alphaproteobacteria bacterium]|nr:glycosyltransferase [Alphaproteobacteria bacterium]
MSISVVIPTRDRPGLLPRALRSVAAQVRPPDEVVVVNDGGQPLRLEGARIVEAGPGAGAGIARNVGAAAARCAWLAFLDDDDEWHPAYLEEAEACSRDADLVLTAFTKVRANGEVLPEKVPPERLETSDVLVRNPGLRGSNLFIRRSVYLGLRGFDETLACAQDLDLAVRLADARLRVHRNCERRVNFHAHAAARISTPSPLNAYGNRTYLARQGRRMAPAQVAAFRARTRKLFGTDPGEVPRLVWVLGPPGAGKSTWARSLADAEQARVLELAALLDWRDGADVGVARAKEHLISAIRSVELQRAPGERRLFVASAWLPPGALRPLSPLEHVVALVPRREDWELRLKNRGDSVGPEQIARYRWWSERYGVGAEAAYRACLEAE